MARLTEQILTHAKGLPEGTAVSAKGLLHLANRAAVDQALSRLSERGQLIRASRGIYMRPIASRFGTRAPSVEQAVEAIARQKGEIIVSNGAAAANALGLTTQVPVRSVYLTSGRSRKMRLGKQVVELHHAPRWQLALADRPAGEAVRALAWLGPERAEAALTTLKRKMPPGVFGELVAAAPQLPTWLAQSVGKVAYGRMIEDGLLFDDVEPFEAFMTRCEDITARANRAGAYGRTSQTESHVEDGKSGGELV